MATRVLLKKKRLEGQINLAKLARNVSTLALWLRR